MTIREAMSGQDAYAAPAASSSTSSTPSGLPSASPSSPYWLQAPSKVLYGLRSTADLPATADVVIIGTGITGAFAADALVSEGASVVMLEAREACYGATGRNGGHCQPGVYSAPPDIASFELATFRFIRDLVEHHKIPCDWRTLPRGGVHAYLDEDLFSQARRLVAALQTIAPDLAELVHVVDRDSTDPVQSLAGLRLNPETIVGAVVQTHAASVWPYRLVAWLLERLVKTHPASEFNLQTTTPVLKLAPSSSGDSKGYPWAVSTDRGVIAAKKVLLATNGYTSHLLPAMADLIVPVRGQVAALLPPKADESAASAESAASSLLPASYVFLGLDPNFGGGDSDDYLVQRPFVPQSSSSSSPAPFPGGHLILGGGRQRAAEAGINQWRDDDVEPAVAAYLRQKLVPVLDVGQAEKSKSQGAKDVKDELKADYEWTGVMGFSRDGHPWVGEVPSLLAPGGDADSDSNAPGLYVCAGYTGHGMPNAALSAVTVAHLIRRELALPAGLSAGSAVAFAPDSSAASLAASQLPDSYRISAARVRRVRASTAEVKEAHAGGTAAEFADAVEEMEALAAKVGK